MRLGMKEEILNSLKANPKIKIIEQIEDGNFFGIHYSYPGTSEWQDGVHGYALIQRDKVLGKAISVRKASANSYPQTLAKYIKNIKEAQSIK